MPSPSEKRKLRDIHLKLSLLDQYLMAMRDRGAPFGQDEIEKIEEALHKQTERIYGILDPPCRRSSGK